jgi:hypothetical protein
MADAYSVVRYPEKLSIFSGAWTPDTGTETLSSVACTLRDATGAVAGGVNAAAATGFTDGASAAPVAWLDIDPIALALTQPTFATGQSVYSLEFVATDSAGKRYSSTVAIVLKPAGA